VSTQQIVIEVSIFLALAADVAALALRVILNPLIFFCECVLKYNGFYLRSFFAFIERLIFFCAILFPTLFLSRAQTEISAGVEYFV
jgi:hypothetical protein